MLSLLAQTFTREVNTVEGGEGFLAGLFAASLAMIFIWLVVAAVMVISLWKIFEKANKPGWAAIVPVYNYWVAAEIAGYPGWVALVVLVAWIPVLGAIAALAVAILVSIGIAKAFGKEPVWALLLILVPIVGYPILAFGDAKYKGAPEPLIDLEGKANKGSSDKK